MMRPGARMMPNLFGARRSFATMEKTFLSSDLQFIERKELKQKPGPDHVYAFGAL